MSRLKRLIVQVHERSLWQILCAYVAGSWLALQVADTVTAVLGLPDWVPQLAGVVCAMGLPLVLATATVQKGGPFKPPPATEPAESVARTWRRWLTWRHALAAVLIGFGLLGAGVTGYMAMRTLGLSPVGTLMAKGIMEPRERIVLAEFESGDQDTLLAALSTDR